jgi:hypothetical protein
MQDEDPDIEFNEFNVPVKYSLKMFVIVQIQNITLCVERQGVP